ncbi:hypothetical protein C1646_673910 [Rhizophagus diaphanus]|nr:hypothetical protein C1646_673910 [Rhizophagus diaphanus] [Rhizophagus sp. MUCL 43196]
MVKTENFNCSSGDPKLDDLIRHKQKNAKENMDFLEWIDFSQFDLIKYTGKEGSFSTIYSALWMECPFWTGMKLQDRISKEVGEARGDCGGRSARVEVVMDFLGIQREVRLCKNPFRSKRNKEFFSA